MHITKSPNHVLFEIQQDEYSYWETFCDFFIERCTQIIEGKQGTKKLKQHFQSFKECLELILFTVDISKQDKICTVQIPTMYLSLFQSLMDKWHEKLQHEIQQAKSKQTDTNNGEKKRRLYQRQTHLEQVLQMNIRINQNLKEYQAG